MCWRVFYFLRADFQAFLNLFHVQQGRKRRQEEEEGSRRRRRTSSVIMYRYKQKKRAWRKDRKALETSFCGHS